MSSSVCGGPTQRLYRNHVALQTDFIEVEHNWDLVVARHKGREHAPPRMLRDAVQAYRQDRKSNETPCGMHGNRDCELPVGAKPMGSSCC